MGETSGIYVDLMSAAPCKGNPVIQSRDGLPGGIMGVPLATPKGATAAPRRTCAEVSAIDTGAVRVMAAPAVKLIASPAVTETAPAAADKAKAPAAVDRVIAPEPTVTV